MLTKFKVIMCCSILVVKLMLLSNVLSGQDFYYYQGKRIYLTPNYNNYIIKFDKQMAETDIANFLESAGIVYESPEEIIPGFIKLEIPDSLIKILSSIKQSPKIKYMQNTYLYESNELIFNNEIVVQFKTDVTESEIKKMIELNNLTIVKKDNIFHNNYIFSLPFDKLSNELKVSNRLHESPLTEYAEPNMWGGTKLHTNDTYYSDHYPLSIVNASSAWGETHGLSQIVVAVIDVGVDLNQEDLNDKLVSGYDVTNQGDDSPQPRGDDYHGTACAGIIAAETDNGQGVAGLAWNYKLMPVQIFYHNDQGNLVDNTTWIAHGISLAWRNGAHVLSNSWGRSAGSNIITQAIDSATTYGRNGKGSIVIFSSGNDDLSLVSYPARLLKVIAVGATNQQDVMWDYSNYGDSLDVMAPSGNYGGNGDVWTTDIMNSAGANSGSLDYGDANGHYYKKFGGTSAEAPLVSGLAALLLSDDSTLTRLEVETKVKYSSKDLGTPGWDQNYGYGRIDA